MDWKPWWLLPAIAWVALALLAAPVGLAKPSEEASTKDTPTKDERGRESGPGAADDAPEKGKKESDSKSPRGEAEAKPATKGPPPRESRADEPRPVKSRESRGFQESPRFSESASLVSSSGPAAGGEQDASSPGGDSEAGSAPARGPGAEVSVTESATGASGRTFDSSQGAAIPATEEPARPTLEAAESASLSPAVGSPDVGTTSSSVRFTVDAGVSGTPSAAGTTQALGEILQASPSPTSDPLAAPVKPAGGVAASLGLPPADLLGAPADSSDAESLPPWASPVIEANLPVGAAGGAAAAVLAAGLGIAGSLRFRPSVAVPGVPHPARAAAIARPRPAPTSGGWEQGLRVSDLLERVRTNPLDGIARFELGIALLKADHLELGLKHLDRAFRLFPEALLRFLEDPAFGPLRQRDEVKRILRRFQRDQERRLWMGYA